MLRLLEKRCGSADDIAFSDILPEYESEWPPLPPPPKGHPLYQELTPTPINLRSINRPPVVASKPGSRYITPPPPAPVRHAGGSNPPAPGHVQASFSVPPSVTAAVVNSAAGAGAAAQGKSSSPRRDLSSFVRTPHATEDKVSSSTSVMSGSPRTMTAVSGASELVHHVRRDSDDLPVPPPPAVVMPLNAHHRNDSVPPPPPGLHKRDPSGSVAQRRLRV